MNCYILYNSADRCKLGIYWIQELSMQQKYISIDNLIAALIYFIAFLRMPFVGAYNDLKHLVLISAIIYCLYYFSYIDRKYLKINIALVVFVLWTMLSAVINRHNTVSWNIMSTATYFAFLLLGMGFSLEILVARIGYRNLVDIFFKCAVFTIVLEDLYIFSGRIVWQGDSTIFPLGSKFAVMYQHLILLCLLLQSTRTHVKLKKFVFPYIVFLILMGIKVDCVTGMVGTVMFVVIWIVLKRFPKFFTKPIAALLVELIAFSYIFLGVFIMNDERVVSFIDNYMGGAGTMLARVGIYQNAFPLIMSTPVLGFGYGTTYEIGMAMAGFSNTQNSLYQWAWYAGIPATIVILAIIMISFEYIQKRYLEDNFYDIYILALFYVYILLGAIEILMDQPFFTILGMAMISAEDKVLEKTN